MSGVTVATTTRSRSAGSTHACSSAWRDAGSARSLAACPGSATCRSLIPVRSVIHSSEVSTSFDRSSLVITLSGTYDPTPRIPIAPFWETFASISGALAVGDGEHERRTSRELAVHRGRRLAAPDGPAHSVDLAGQLQLVAGKHHALEAHVVDPGKEGQFAAVGLVGEDRDRAALRHRLDDDHTGHDRTAREVAGQEPLVLPHELARDDAGAGLEHRDLVQEEERVAVRQDLF